jgi:adenosylmethionine-8-amino-7-oxononanoate aminotransferase
MKKYVGCPTQGMNGMSASSKGKKHEIWETAFLRPWSRQTSTIWIERGEGAWLYDKEGKKYFDLTSGAFNVSLGYNARLLRETICRQLGYLPYLHPMFDTEVRDKLCRALIESTNGAFSKAYICCGGSEAVKAAIVFAVHFTERRSFLRFDKGYHGPAILSPCTYDTQNNQIVYEVPAPYCHRCPWGVSLDSCRMQCLETLYDIIEDKTNELAALVIEPIIGINGVIVIPDEYLKKAREITSRHGVLLIYDEVLTGCGRTGQMYAYQHNGIIPDMICIGKGINSGYLPIGVTMVSKQIAEKLEAHPIAYGGTNIGHPIVCASALTCLKEIQKNELLRSVHSKGIMIKNFCLTLMENNPDLISDVRGKGLLLGMELFDAKEGRPLLEKEMAYFTGLLAQAGILVDLDPSCSVLPIAPPLVVDNHDLVVVLERITECIQKFRVWKRVLSSSST